MSIREEDSRLFNFLPGLESVCQPLQNTKKDKCSIISVELETGRKKIIIQHVKKTPDYSTSYQDWNLFVNLFKAPKWYMFNNISRIRNWKEKKTIKHLKETPSYSVSHHECTMRKLTILTKTACHFNLSTRGRTR